MNIFLKNKNKNKYINSCSNCSTLKNNNITVKNISLTSKTKVQFNHNNNNNNNNTLHFFPNLNQINDKK